MADQTTAIGLAALAGGAALLFILQRDKPKEEDGGYSGNGGGVPPITYPSPGARSLEVAYGRSA